MLGRHGGAYAALGALPLPCKVLGMAGSSAERAKLRNFWAQRATAPLQWRDFDGAFIGELLGLFHCNSSVLLRISEVTHFALLPQWRVRPIAAYWSLKCWLSREQPMAYAEMEFCAAAGRQMIINNHHRGSSTGASDDI